MWYWLIPTLVGVALILTVICLLVVIKRQRSVPVDLEESSHEEER